MIPILIVLLGCPREEAGPDIRGGGYPVAQLSPAARAAVYDRALRESFDVNEALVLLIDPARLPRAGGWQRDERVPSPVLSSLEGLGAVRGRCEATGDTTHAPRCDHVRPGYVVRVSDIFDRAGDSVRVFVAWDQYQPAAEAGTRGRFSFEDGYDLIPNGNAWRVVRRARRSRT